MRKLLYIILFTSFTLNGYSQKLDLMSIINRIANELQDRQQTYQTIVNEEIIINSVSNSNLAGGKNRVYLKLNIPKDATSWVYRITVLDKNSQFKYQDNETLSWQLINRRVVDRMEVNQIPINVYFMNNSSDAYAFTLKREFKSFQQYNILNVNSFTASSNLNADNLYIGIENLSPFSGAKILLEIVALTPKQIYRQINTFQADKQVKEAKELFDLGVISRKSYDSIIQLYTPKINRAEALERLKLAKEQLDKGEITQAQYDEIKNALTPIILNK
jgi:hypothetical protein